MNSGRYDMLTKEDLLGETAWNLKCMQITDNDIENIINPHLNPELFNHTIIHAIFEPHISFLTNSTPKHCVSDITFNKIC